MESAGRFRFLAIGWGLLALTGVGQVVVADDRVNQVLGTLIAVIGTLLAILWWRRARVSGDDNRTPHRQTVSNTPPPSPAWYRSRRLRVLFVCLLGLGVGSGLAVITGDWSRGLTAGALSALVSYGFWSAVASGDRRGKAPDRMASAPSPRHSGSDQGKHG